MPIDIKDAMRALGEDEQDELDDCECSECHESFAACAGYEPTPDQLCDSCAQGLVPDLRAEVERLKAELATRTERGDQMLKEANEDFLRESAENARLKAELETQSLELRGLAEGYELELRELREAAEAHVKLCPTISGTWLEAVLAKMPTP